MMGFILGMLLYVVAVFVAYSDKIKTSMWYMPIGLGLAILTNLIWLLMLKHMGSNQEILEKAFTWDAMRLLIYAIIPIIFLGVPLTPHKVLAIVMIGAGMYLLNHH